MWEINLEDKLNAKHRSIGKLLITIQVINHYRSTGWSLPLSV